MDIMYAAVDSRNVSISYILFLYDTGWVLKLIQQSLEAKGNDSTIIKNKEKMTQINIQVYQCLSKTSYKKKLF